MGGSYIRVDSDQIQLLQLPFLIERKVVCMMPDYE